jgi:hypothetical protein
MKLAAIWAFIAGDSKRAPLGVALAVALIFALERWAPQAGAWIGALFVALIGAALVAGVFERAD